MDPQSIPLKTTGIRFVRAVRTFAQSEVGWKAKLIFAALVLLLCASNALNVVNSYVGRNFMTAIADRDMSGFVRQAFFYIGVFAALTIVAVIARFGEERLGLLWRDTMTRGILRRYLADGTYQRLNVSGTIANPDQRISEDVLAFTVTTLSFALMALNSAFTIVAFAGVLWTISPLLFGVAVLYAAGGSLFTFVFGRPLIRLNYDQLEPVRKVYEGLQSLRSMRRMEASRRNASALSVRFSKSLARRRQRFSQAIVRSTTQRIGRTSNPLALSDRFTISTASPGRRLATVWANCGPW